MHRRQPRECGNRWVGRPHWIEWRSLGAGQALAHQELVGRHALTAVMMKPTPVSSLEVAQAKLLFELFVVEIDPPSPIHAFLETPLSQEEMRRAEMTKATQEPDPEN